MCSRLMLTFLLFSLIVKAGTTNDEVINKLDSLAKTIKSHPELAKGASFISSPQAPEGYVLELKGSDTPEIIKTNGQVNTPMVDSEVQLYYQLVDPKTGNKADVPNLLVQVPGEFTADEDANPCPEIIPQIREWLGGKGNLNFSQSGIIAIGAEDFEQLESPALLLAEDLKAFGNYTYEVKKSANDAARILLSIDDTDQVLGEEGYRLTIDKNIRIEAPSAKGVIMGTKTVLQLINRYGSELPMGIARDYPKYRRRGFMIDVGRKFFTMDYLRNYVRIMSYYKMNELQVHLSDNGFKQFFDNDWNKSYAAFRLESETYPGLTAKDGSYTKKEFADLQKLGMEYGVNVIPEIDVPAHSLAFTQYRPDLGSKEYGMDHLDINNPDTYTFLDALFEEYLGGENPVFIGPDVHIGTDEYDKKEAESFRRFTNHYLKKVQSYGFRARFWGSLTHAKGETPVTSENVIMNAWYNGYANPRDMIDQGYELISTSDRHLYIVPAAGYYYDYLNIKFLFDKWEPNLIGGDVFPFGHPQISGGMGAIWNDHVGNGISEKDAHHRCFPAIQVLAQKMWKGKNKNFSYNQYMKSASQLVEAPGVNIMGKIEHEGRYILKYDFASSKDEDITVNNNNISDIHQTYWKENKGHHFTKDSYIELPVEEIGYNYEVAFVIEISSKTDSETTLFESQNAQFVLTPKDGKIQLGFKRDGYFYQFNTLLDYDRKYAIAIKGDNKGTSLVVDSSEVERLQGLVKEYKKEDGRISKMYIQQTLVFPLRKIGGFDGTLHSLSVQNTK